MRDIGSEPGDEGTDAEEEEPYGSLMRRARELARAGRLPEALEVVRTVPIPRFQRLAHERTGTLISIVTKMVEGGARAEAGRVLEEARQSCAAMQEGTVWEAADGSHRIARLLARSLALLARHLALLVAFLLLRGLLAATRLPFSCAPLA